MPAPLVPPPASDIGAMTIPRYLQRWLDVNPVTKLDRTSTFIQLLTFAQVNSTWNGYSDIIFAFNFESPNSFSLKGLTIPVSSNYALCISYQVQGVVTRYILWDAVGSRLPETFPPYKGQPIKRNFRFEIWNTSQGVVSESSVLNFYTSKLGPFDYRYGQDGALVNPDPVVSQFSVNGGGEVNLPLNAIVDYQPTSGIALTGSNTISTWTDTLRGQVLTASPLPSFVVLAPHGGINNGPNVFIGGEAPEPPGYMNTTFISNQVAMVIIFLDLVIPSGTFFTTGTGGTILGVTNTTGSAYLTAFGSTGVVPLINTLSYLLVVDSNNGILWVINANDASIIDKIKGTPINPNTGTETVIGVGTPPAPANPDSLLTGGVEIVTGGQPILAQ